MKQTLTQIRRYDETASGLLSPLHLRHLLSTITASRVSGSRSGDNEQQENNPSSTFRPIYDFEARDGQVSIKEAPWCNLSHIVPSLYNSSTLFVHPYRFTTSCDTLAEFKWTGI